MGEIWSCMYQYAMEDNEMIVKHSYKFWDGKMQQGIERFKPVKMLCKQSNHYYYPTPDP